MTYISSGLKASEEALKEVRFGSEFSLACFSLHVGLPVAGGFHVEAGKPSAAADVGVDIDGVAEVEGKVGGLLGGVSTHHDLTGLVRAWGPEFFVDQGEGMLFGDGDVVLEIGVDVDVGFGFVVRLGVADEVPVGVGDGGEAFGAV